MSARRTFGRVGNPVISARDRGSGRPVSVGRPVVPGAPDLRKMTVVRCPSESTRDASCGTRFWVEFWDFGGKIDEISWMKDGETWGNVRSTRNQANPWIKSNETSSNQQITKKILGLFLVGIYEFRTKSRKKA